MMSFLKKIEIKIGKGQSAEFVLKFKGTKKTSKERLLLSVKDVFMNQDGIFCSKKRKGKNSISKWISLSKKEIILSYNKESSCKLRINIPSDVTSGGYYIALFITPTEKEFITKRKALSLN